MMNLTPFVTPYQVHAHEDAPSLSWKNPASAIGRGAEQFAITNKPLHTISGLWQERFADKSDQLWFDNFDFTINGSTLLGIEVQFNSRRLDRVQDYIVQLTLNGERIGDNLADPSLADFKIYGAPDNLWGTNLHITDVVNATFGVVISLRSNVITPHSDHGLINQVAMRITYA